MANAIDMNTPVNCTLAYIIAPKSEYSSSGFFQKHSNRLVLQNSQNLKTSLTKAVEELKCTAEGGALFAICCTDIAADKWINFNLIKSDNGEFMIVIKHSFNTRKEKCRIKSVIRSIITEDMVRDIPFIKVDNDSKESALEHMKCFIKALQDLPKQNLEVSQQKLVVEIFLDTSLTTKGRLEYVLSLLNKIVYKDSEYYLNFERLQKLTATLINQNFKFDYAKDSKDLRLEVIKLLAVFKRRSPQFDQEGSSAKILQDYLKRNKNKYVEEIAQYKETLEKCAKDEKAKTSLIRATELRLEFLTNIEDLAPDLLEISDFDEFIKLLGGLSELQESLNSLKSAVAKIQQQETVLPFTDNQAVDEDFYKNACNQRKNPSYLYQAGDFRTLANPLFSRYKDIKTLVLDNGKNKRNKFGLIYNNIETAKRNLGEQLQDLSMPKLVYYNISNSHWVCFAAVAHDGNVNILYKDSLGVGNDELKDQIQEIFSGKQVNFIHNTIKEQTGAVECGVFALENMRIMAEYLTHHCRRHGFMDEFSNFPNFCKSDIARKLREGYFAKLFVLGKYQQSVDCAINDSKLKAVRVRHLNEAEEIRSYLTALAPFQDLTIIALKDDEVLDQSQKNTIAIQIATNSGITDPEAEGYVYYYHILFSKDLRPERVTEILDRVESTLKITCDRDTNNFNASEVACGIVKFPAKPILDDEVSIVDVQISDLLDHLHVPYNSASNIIDLLRTPSPLDQKEEDLHCSLVRNSSSLITNLKQFAADRKELEAQDLKIKELSTALDNKRVINAAISIDKLIVLLEKKVRRLDEDVCLSKETLEVLVESDISDKRVVKSLLKLLNSCETSHIKIKEFSSKTLSKLSIEDVDLVLEVKKLFCESEEDLVKFVHKKLLTHEDARNKALELIKSYNLVAKSGYMRRIIKFVNSYNNCREFIAIPENRALIQEMIAQADELPPLFVQEFKDLVKSKSKKQQDKLDAIKVGKFLIQNGDIQLEEFADVQILLDSPNLDVRSATLDMIYEELIRVRKLDADIQAKIMKIGNKSVEDKVSNILDKIEEFSETVFCLSNPREEIERRRAAINDVRYPTPRIVDVLVDIIKYEQDLRSDAFTVLVKILPNDEVYSIDFEEVFHCLESCIAVDSVDDLIKLCKNSKSAQDKEIVVGILVQIACGYAEKKENSIEMLSKIDEQLLDSRRLVFNEDQWGGIMRLRDCPGQLDELMLNIEENIKREFQITEDKIQELVKHFASGSVEMKSKIAAILLAIDSHQELRDTNSIYRVIGTTELECISELVVRDICRGKRVNPLVQEFILSRPMEGNNLVNLLYSFVDKKSTPPTSLLKLVSKYLDSPEGDVSLQIQVTELISQVIKNCESPAMDIFQVVIDTLKKVSLEIRTNHQDYFLNHTAFKALDSISEISRNEQFLNEYIAAFKKRKFYQYLEDRGDFQIIDGTEVEQIFQSFDNFSPEEKYYLLQALNSHYSNTPEIKSAFALSKSQDCWRQEILEQTLLSGSLRYSDQLSSEARRVELKKFRENIKILDDSTSNYLSNILQALVDKQQSYNFGMKVVNDILTLLGSKLEAAEILIQNDCSLDWYLELKKIWLASTLEKYRIVHSEEQFNKFAQYSLGYTTYLIENILHRAHKEDTEIDLLIQFLAKLENSGFDMTKREEFLMLGTRGLSDPNAWIAKLNKEIVEQHLNAKNLPIDRYDREKLHLKLTQMLSSGWLLSSIEQVIDCLNADNIKPMIAALDPIYEYKLREYERDLKNRNLLSILQGSSEHWLKATHDLAVLKTFTGSYDKKVEELNREIRELNRGKEISLFHEDQLLEKYRAVIKCYHTEGISKWLLEDITSWAKAIKKNTLGRFTAIEQITAIAVIIRAVELTGRKHSPRAIQLLSLLTLLNPEQNKGRLAQINTGEGKTTIVAMLAAIKALEGNTVDIITSSPELAKPQSKEQEEFFVTLGLTVANDCKSSSVNILESYKADIVYGSAGDFQGDILRDEYNKEGIRSGRGFGIAIVDEVDSMLIDSRNHIVMLSSPMPAMDNLEVLLALIWIQMQLFADSIVGKDGEPYKNGEAYYKVRENAINDQGQLIEGNETLCPIENKEEFIKDGTRTYIRKILRDYKHLPENDEEGNNIEATMRKQDAALEEFNKRLKANPNLQEDPPICYPRLNIPKHLEEFVTEVQLEKWIENAIHAQYRCQENKHYVLRDGKILPVDASNTGVVQQNMNWSDGLHQFLQIKHGAKITPESITTNFISNVTFFRRYKHNIYGLTGTLGGNGAQELLNTTYNVDSVIMPPFRKKQYRELTSITASTEDNWFQTIAENSVNKLNNGRGVLVITKYIKEVDEIKGRLEKLRYDPDKIKIYKTEDDSNIIEELKEAGLNPGEIIIATNIAGRGTDIRISSQLEKNGGLHVCVTFLPPNERIAKQNEGRVARAGERGTGQFILLEKSGQTIDHLKKIRDRKEEEGLQKARKEIVRITNKDAIFELFCAWLDDIGIDRANMDEEKKSEFKALEERFGLWLKIHDRAISESTASDISTKFEQFKKTIAGDTSRIKNPSYHVLMGNEFLTKQNYLRAIEEFDKAISLDPEFAVNAFYNRGYCRLAQYGGDAQKNSEQINLAIADMRQARRIIEDNLEPMLNIIQKASSSPVLSEQVRHKFILYGVQKNAIESAVGIGVDGMKSREIEEDQELNRRIRNGKIDQRREALSGLSEEEIARKLTEFEKTLPPITESERNALREKDISAGIRASKIAAEGAKIEAKYKSNPKDLKVKKEAFDNFKNGITAKSNQERFYSEFERNVSPSEKEIADIKKDIKAQKEILEKGVIGKAISNTRNMEIKLVDIKEALPQDENVSLYGDEIREYENNGFKGSFQISEIKPIDWASVLGVALIGLGQLVAGGALTVFTLGAGASIGMGLMSEGVSDLIIAVKDGIINRDFSWASYGIQKVISLTVSLVCAGLGALKDAAKTAVSGARQAVSAVAKGVTQTVKQGWKLAAKAIGTSLAKGIAKEVVTQVMNYGVSKALMPSIQNEIQSRLEKPIQNALLANSKVQEMLELDATNDNNKYQTLIKQKAMEILNPERNEESPLLTIAKGIAEGIAKNKIPGLSTILEINDAMDAIEQLSTFASDFIKKLNVAIDEIYTAAGLDKQTILVQSLTREVVAQLKKKSEYNKSWEPKIRTDIKNALSSNKRVKEMLSLDSKNKNSKYQNLIKQKLREKQFSMENLVAELQGAIGEVPYSQPSKTAPLPSESNTSTQDVPVQLLPNTANEDNDAGDIDLSQRNEQASQVRLAVDNSAGALTSSLSSSVSGRMSNIVEGRLIRKLTSKAANWGVDKFAAAHDEALQDSLGTYKAKRRIYFMQSGDKDDRVPREFKEEWVDEHAQREKSADLINNLESGGEAGVMVLGALSDLTGQPVAIYDQNGKIVEIIGEDKGGDMIKVQHVQNPNGTGHWIVPGNPDITSNIENNNCLFAAVAAQCHENDPQALRMATVNHMRTNIDSLARQIPDIERVAKYEYISLRQGGGEFVYDSVDTSKIYSCKGSTKFFFNAVEGHPIAEGADPAHAIARHVGRVKGKSTFKNKEMLCQKYNEVLSKDPKELIIINERMPKDRGDRKKIIAKVKKFDGYDNGQPCTFKYIKIIHDKPDKPEGIRYFLPQTVIPLKKLTDADLT